MVFQVDAHGEREGVRGGSNVLVQVDALSAFNHGAKFFRSRTQRGVYLTAGITERYLCGGDFRERIIGLPKEFLLSMVDRVTGMSVQPEETVDVNVHGAPQNLEGAALQGEIIATQEEADRICSQVDYQTAFDAGEMDGS